MFTDGSRVAVGDVTGDGVPDLVTIAGLGGGPRVIVFDGRTGKMVETFFAFDSTFRGGGYVAVADVNRDGFADIIVGAGEGGGPEVKVFSGRDLSVLANFFAYDPTFRGGVRVGAGDVDGDGLADVVTAPGDGGGPHIEAFRVRDGALLANFFSDSPDQRGGAYVAVADVNRDGLGDIITGAGIGAEPNVSAFNARDGSKISTFLAYDSGFRGGVRVAAGTAPSGTGTVIWTGAGPGGGPRVEAFDATTLTPLESIFAFDSAGRDGIYVGAGFTLVVPPAASPPVSPPVTTLPPSPPVSPPISPPSPPVVPPTTPPATSDHLPGRSDRMVGRRAWRDER
jgi:fibronectin-binding autotransporter adhesin